MRRVVVGLIAIAVFTGVAVVAIWALTRDGSPRPPAPAGEPQAYAAPTEQALPAVPLPAAPAAPDIQAVVIYGPPKVEPPKDSWEAVPIVARASALGPLGGAIGRGLNDLQSQLADCFDEDVAARHGTQPHTVALDASLPNSGTPVLVLQIETGGGGAHIVDAPVDTQGYASDGVIACAQNLLRGRRFKYPQAQPGQKYRLLHSLIP